MENSPTLNQSKSKTQINSAFSLDLAGWIMSRYKNQRLVKVDLWEHEGRTDFACEFETAPEEKCDYREFIRDREARPQELRKTIAAGLEQLTGYLNRALEGFESGTALNTNREQLQENAGLSNLEDSKKIAALDAEKEAVHG